MTLQRQVLSPIPTLWLGDFWSSSTPHHHRVGNRQTLKIKFIDRKLYSTWSSFIDRCNLHPTDCFTEIIADIDFLWSKDRVRLDLGFDQVNHTRKKNTIVFLHDIYTATVCVKLIMTGNRRSSIDDHILKRYSIINIILYISEMKLTSLSSHDENVYATSRRFNTDIKFVLNNEYFALPYIYECYFIN